MKGQRDWLIFLVLQFVLILLGFDKKKDETRKRKLYPDFSWLNSFLDPQANCFMIFFLHETFFC